MKLLLWLRLSFAELAPRREHLWRLRCADIALDTPLYNSHTLGADYLWAGVPMLTGLLESTANADNVADNEIRASHNDEKEMAPEQKFSSRVGASLVLAAMPGDETGGSWDENNDSDASLLSYSSEALARKWLVAPNWSQGLEDAAVALVNHPHARVALVDALARGRAPGSSRAPLFDTRRWARALARGILTAWPLRPRTFDIQSGFEISDTEPAMIHIDVPEESREISSKTRHSRDGSNNDLSKQDLFDNSQQRLAGEVRTIVLERQLERRAHFESEIATALPEAQPVPAVDAVTSPLATQEVLTELGVTLAPFWAAEATAGQVGCTASHVSLWAEAAADADSIASSDAFKFETPNGRPYTVVLEDDAVVDFSLFRPTIEAMVHELGTSASSSSSAGSNDSWDLCYLYVYPDHWPTPPTRATNHPAVAKAVEAEASPTNGPSKTHGGLYDPGAETAVGTGAAVVAPLVQDGFHTYCLLAYLVSPAGARKLAHLVKTEVVISHLLLIRFPRKISTFSCKY